ncbi:MAG: hypothetical protein ACI828_001783 [Flavobacteriales bacterium]
MKKKFAAKELEYEMHTWSIFRPTSIMNDN